MCSRDSSTPIKMHNAQVLDARFRKLALGRFVAVADAQRFTQTKVMEKCRLKIIGNIRDTPRADKQFFSPLRTSSSTPRSRTFRAFRTRPVHTWAPP